MTVIGGEPGVEQSHAGAWWVPEGNSRARVSRRAIRPPGPRRARSAGRRAWRRDRGAAVAAPPVIWVTGRWPIWARRAALLLVALCGGLALVALLLARIGQGAGASPRPAPVASERGIPGQAYGVPSATQGQRYPAAPGGPAGGPGPESASAGALAPPRARAPGPGELPATPPIVPNPLDPGQWTQWAKDLFNALTVQFFTGILDAIRGLVAAIFGTLGTDQGNMLLPLPPAMTYDHPVVRQYQGLLIGAANAGLACVLALGGLNVMLKDRIGATYQDAMELLPRFLVGAALVNLSRQPGALLIDFTNAAIAGVGSVGAPGWGALPADVRTIGDVLLAIFYLVALLCVILQVYLRLVLVDLLLILTPLALLAWILPQSQEIARRWTNALVSTVLAFFVQSLALKVGAALLQAGLTDTSGTGALASLFLGGAFFVLLFRLPGMISQHSGGGTIGRVLLARLAMGAVSRGGAGPRGRA